MSQPEHTPLPNTRIIQVDYRHPQQTSDLCSLLNAYARDPMGGGKPIESERLASLPGELAKLPNAISWLCYIDEQPAAMANGFIGFSTFQVKPLLNIHDFAVLKAFRGMGLSQKLLKVIEQYARQKQCCKLTLEVLQGNEIARQAYHKFGFASYTLDPQTGQALFWEKSL